MFDADRKLPIGQTVLLVIVGIGWAVAVVATLLQMYAEGRFGALLVRPLPRVICGIVSMACIVCGGPAMLLSSYYFLCALANKRPERELLSHFLAPVSMLLPQLYTEAGNRYRKRHLLTLFVFLLFAAIPLVCQSLVP